MNADNTEGTPEESDADRPLLGIDEELKDLGLGKEARSAAVGALVAGVLSGFLPESWLGIGALGCLRSAIVLGWSGIGCLLGTLFILATSAIVTALGLTGSELGTNVNTILFIAGLALFIVIAFAGSVVTIRRFRPWRK